MNEPVLIDQRRRLLGCFERRERWGLTWRGRLIGVLLAVLLAWGGIRYAHEFLAVDDINNSGVLVVEGWIPTYALTGYVARCTNYARIYTTGGPTVSDFDSVDDSDTHASVARSRLLKAGVPPEKVIMVPARHSGRDRTYSSAVALRQWCQTNGVQLAAFNVITMGPHARRSRLLHEKAFGPTIEVGVIPLENRLYDGKQWWRYSEGVKKVISEGAAYVYARIFFDASE